MKRRIGISLLVLVVGCATEAGEPSTSSISSPLQPAPTTVATTSTSMITTTPSTTTTTFPPSRIDCPPALVVADEISLVGVDCSTAVVSLPESVRAGDGLTVMDDLGGGLIYQTDPSAILRLEPGGESAVPLVEAGEGESLSLEDLVRADNGTEVWFTRWSGQDVAIVGREEALVQTLEGVAVEGGAPTALGQVGGWEWGSSITVGGGVLAIQGSGEGFYEFSILDLDLVRLPQPWNPYDEPKDMNCDGCPTDLVVADDGWRVAYLAPIQGESRILPVVLVVDVEAGEEVARLEVSGFGWWDGNPTEGPKATELDVLGDYVIVNGEDQGEPLPAIWSDLGADEPVWGELPVPGRARLLRSDISATLLD